MPLVLHHRVKQYPALATHKGYDDDLCHGDVTLSFIHNTKSLSRVERKKILQIKRKTEEAASQKAQEATDGKTEALLTRLAASLVLPYVLFDLSNMASTFWWNSNLSIFVITCMHSVFVDLYCYGAENFL